ncbi:MAG: DNA repair protein RecO [Bdellovibrionales bacterium]|jgi:DNA repair protein RecO (recombination protein O)
MEWKDEGIVLSARPHGETAMIVTLLTAAHGCHAGLVHGGQSRRRQSLLQAGNHVEARWNARLTDHLGNYTLEPLTAFAAPWLSDPEILALLASATTIIEASLPERQPMPRLFDSLIALFSLPDRSLWAPAYIRWEMGVLEALGYGMDLSCCALTGPRTALPLSVRAQAAPSRKRPPRPITASCCPCPLSCAATQCGMRATSCKALT